MSEGPLRTLFNHWHQLSFWAQCPIQNLQFLGAILGHIYPLLSFQQHLQPSVWCLQCLLWTRSITPAGGDNTQIIICNRKWNSKNRPADMQPRTSHCLQLHFGVMEQKSRRHKRIVYFSLLQCVPRGSCIKGANQLYLSYAAHFTALIKSYRSRHLNPWSSAVGRTLLFESWYEYTGPVDHAGDTRELATLLLVLVYLWGSWHSSHQAECLEEAVSGSCKFSWQSG